MLKIVEKIQRREKGKGGNWYIYMLAVALSGTQFPILRDDSSSSKSDPHLIVIGGEHNQDSYLIVESPGRPRS